MNAISLCFLGSEDHLAEAHVLQVLDGISQVGQVSGKVGAGVMGDMFVGVGAG
jgi:hypothetical protein